METHSTFGTSNYESETNDYKTRLEFNQDHFIDITISIETYNRDTVFSVVEKNYQVIKEKEKSIKEEIATSLLNLHNEVWNEGQITTKEEFIGRIKLEGILFFCNGNAELYYNDGDLFWGHTIVVDINENGKYEDAQIYG